MAAYGLTSREGDATQRLLTGLPRKAIAAELQISLHTVKRSRQSDAREDRGIQRRTASGAPLWPQAGSATEGSTFGQP
ncbi:MAG: LuxR C-terminal-related transcriptional regulator [Pseudonocardiaceae bacterium]